MCEIANVSLSMPRLNTFQRNHGNHPRSTPSEHYTRSVIFPVYDHLISQLDSRFSTLARRCVDGLLLLPWSLPPATDDQLASILESFKALMPYPERFYQEIGAYRRKIETLKINAPETIMPTDLLNMLPALVFPNLFHILKAVFTYPVTIADVELAHSELDYVKNCQISTMGQDRFNALALLYIHKSVRIDVDDVICRYAQGNQMLNFLDRA